VCSLNPEGTSTLDPIRCGILPTATAMPRLSHGIGQNRAPANGEPRSDAWRTRPSTDVVCSEDLVVHPGLQSVLAMRCTQFREWRTGQSPFASNPNLLKTLLVELTRDGFQRSRDFNVSLDLSRPALMRARADPPSCGSASKGFYSTCRLTECDPSRESESEGSHHRRVRCRPRA
jgi:hypothetical protein